MGFTSYNRESINIGTITNPTQINALRTLFFFGASKLCAYKKSRTVLLARPWRFCDCEPHDKKHSCCSEGEHLGLKLSSHIEKRLGSRLIVLWVHKTTILPTISATTSGKLASLVTPIVCVQTQSRLPKPLNSNYIYMMCRKSYGHRLYIYQLKNSISVVVEIFTTNCSPLTCTSAVLQTTKR